MKKFKEVHSAYPYTTAAYYAKPYEMDDGQAKPDGVNKGYIVA